MKIHFFYALGASLILAVLQVPSALASVADIQSLIERGQYDAAVKMADADLSASPTDPQTRFLKGIALAEMNRAEEAISVFQQLTKDYPELPEPYNNLAVLYAQQREFNKARGALEMAIRTHPSYATAHENLGDVYARLASQAYSNALQLDSANIAAQSKLALIRELMTVSTRSGTATTVASAPAPEPVTPRAPVSEPVAPTTPLPPPQPAAPPAPPAAVTPPPVATTPPPSPTATPASDSAQSVRSAVEAWARAWSNKDVAAYLSHYAADFDPPGNMARNAWKAQREQRVGGKPGAIEVSLEDLDITISGTTAAARFRQHYRSGGFNGSTDKTLRLSLDQGRWLITQELIGRQ
ncbi:MAG: tetratricopeptide repeat protein [Rhodocyclaceae bacterium]|nr:tetratricopeptide repeat protein [Rhodocyclaceae bacterium]